MMESGENGEVLQRTGGEGGGGGYLNRLNSFSCQIRPPVCGIFDNLGWGQLWFSEGQSDNLIFMLACFPGKAWPGSLLVPGTSISSTRLKKAVKTSA